MLDLSLTAIGEVSLTEPQQPQPKFPMIRYNLRSVFSLRNILTVLLIGDIGTFEGWRLFWILDLKDKPD